MGLSQHHAQHLAIGGGLVKSCTSRASWVIEPVPSLRRLPIRGTNSAKKRFMKYFLTVTYQTFLIQPLRRAGMIARASCHKRMRLFSRILRSLQGREGQSFGGLMFTRFCSSDLFNGSHLIQFLACDYVSSPPPPDADATATSTGQDRTPRTAARRRAAADDVDDGPQPRTQGGCCP